jgi:hypothetical protein
MSAPTNVPSVQPDNSDTRLIRGEILKCVDGRWSARDGTTFQPTEQFLVAGTGEALQCWQDGMPSDTIVKEAGKPLPDVDELNSKIPQKSWETGLDGKPRPPWQHNWIVYLIRCHDASAYTFINSTAGARIGVQRLADRVSAMQMLRGAAVAPLVTLGSKPFKTSYGDRLRPDFEVAEWRELGGSVGVQPPAPQIEPPKQQQKKTKAGKPGKPVKPVSLKEEMNDDIPHMG